MTKKNIQQLIEQQAALDAQIAALRNDILAEVRACVEKFDFTAYELGLVKTQHIKPSRSAPKTFPAKTAKGHMPPKYRDPATGRTWSGRGHEPHWMAGHRDEYLIKGD
jgi:DNA-binding protein H-NS